MTRQTNMVYAYFRFYADPSEISDSFNNLCSDWRVMTPSGFNYKEYRCYTDNIGALDDWIGDHHGYITPTREIGFLDGAPSDGVFDQGLLMGVERTFLNNIMLLNGYKPDTRFVFRKMTAQDAGIAHKLSFVCGTEQSISHPVAYTFDSTQVEMLTQSLSGFIDSSDVDSYEIMVETDIALMVGTQYSVTNGVVTDFENAFNRSKNDYLQFISGLNTTGYLIIDLGATFTNISIALNNYWGHGYSTETTAVHYSNSAAGGWTLLDETGAVDGDFEYSAVGISGRYVRITTEPSVGWTARSDIYMLMCS